MLKRIKKVDIELDYPQIRDSIYRYMRTDTTKVIVWSAKYIERAKKNEDVGKMYLGNQFIAYTHESIGEYDKALFQNDFLIEFANTNALK